MSARGLALLEILAVALLLAAGQVLVKRVVSPEPGATLLELVKVALGDWRFWLAVACTATGALLWMRVLATAAVSVAYPLLIGCSLVLVALAGLAFLRESLTAGVWLGVGLVLAGSVLIARG